MDKSKALLILYGFFGFSYERKFIPRLSSELWDGTREAQMLWQPYGCALNWYTCYILGRWKGTDFTATKRARTPFVYGITF